MLCTCAVCSVHANAQNACAEFIVCGKWHALKLLKHIIIQELNIIVALVINYLQTRFHYIQMQYSRRQVWSIVCVQLKLTTVQLVNIC